MSVLKDVSPGFLGFIDEGCRLRNDHRLITAYQKQIEGVGLESLDDDPAYNLITQSLVDRYGKYQQIAAGNEGLGTLALMGAVVAGGYAVYKKFMRSKNNPVLKKTVDAEKNVEKTYTATWLNDREPVNKSVKVSHLSKYTTSPEFNALASGLGKDTDQLLRSISDVLKKANDAWKKIEPIARAWLKGKDDEEQKKLHEQLLALYPESPFPALSKDIKLVPTVKENDHEFNSLSREQYGKAVELLKKLTAAFVTIDNDCEDMWSDLGLYDAFFEVSDDWPGADDFWRYAYCENINDDFGRPLFHARSQLLDLARGLEEWIVKSFK